jgi:hypothetical protein
MPNEVRARRAVRIYLTIGIAINAFALYWLFGGRFRAPDV